MERKDGIIYVLFSGGVDSTYALLWARDWYGPESVRAIYFDFGQRAATMERIRVDYLASLAGVELIIRDDLAGLLADDREDGRVPLRNLVFMAVTALIPHCRAIVFGMLRGEAVEDKNPEFVRLVRQLMGMTVTPYKEFELLCPAEKLTKLQVIARGYNLWPKVFEGFLRQTVSCTKPVADVIACGRCASCFHRWVAMYLASGREETFMFGYPQDRIIYLLRHRKFGELRQILGSGSGHLSISDACRRMWDIVRALDRYCLATRQRGLVRTIL